MGAPPAVAQQYVSLFLLSMCTISQTTALSKQHRAPLFACCLGGVKNTPTGDSPHVATGGGGDAEPHGQQDTKHVSHDHATRGPSGEHS